MTTKQLPRPKVANVPSIKVQQAISEAVSGLFENNDVRCEQHLSENEFVIVMTANGVCATLHIQEIASIKKEGIAS